MNVLPENARQFAVPKHAEGKQSPSVPWDCGSSEYPEPFCCAERNALHSLASLQRGMKHFIHARLSLAFSSRTFKLSLSARF